MTESFRRYDRTLTPVVLTPIPETPPESHPVWGKLVKGIVSHEFSYFAAGMLVFNLNLQWKRDPSKLSSLIRHIRAFFQKYQHLLGGDVQKLFG